MSFAVFINVITIVFCAAVLVQSVRMMRSLNMLKTADLPAIIKALENSTSMARHVLADLKETLRIDGQQNIAAIRDAAGIRDELEVMIGIANASADRMLELASSRKSGQPETEAEDLAA